MTAQISKAIDPKRVGISKSLITSTALCNRKGFYSERIRLEDGSRIPLVPNERMLFGSALDEAILHIALKIRGSEVWSIDGAWRAGMDAMHERAHVSTELDFGTFGNQLETALVLFARDVLLEDGIGDRPRIDFRGALLQGINGESIRVEHPEFGTIIGTPDFIISGMTRDSGRDLVLDLKASSRMKSERDLRSAELAFYAYLYAQKWGGDLPEIGYLTYARTKEPRFQLLVGEATADHLRIAEEYLKTTKSVVERASDAEVGFTTSMCGSCEWRRAIPAVGFDGCSIGRLVAAEEE